MRRLSRFLILIPLAFILGIQSAEARAKKQRRHARDFAGQVCRRGETDKMMCMVCNIYFEARGESHAGKVAVGRTTLTRITKSEYPDSICGVVWQPGQFSWTSKFKTPRLPRMKAKDYATLAASVKAARDVFRLGPNGLTNFCNPRKSSCPWRHEPSCVASLKRIGRHLFCRIG